jgi:hypothetical protein
MIKALVSATLALLITANSTAQQKPADSNYQFMAAFNAEQMLEKMGFDNLMKAMFENKKQDKKNTIKAVADKATIRKALAAIYGAGINFDKKMWMVSWQQLPVDFTAGQYNYKNFVTPLQLLVIPIANKQVMEQNILKLMATEGKNGDTIQFKTTGNTSWMMNGRKVMLLGNTEMVVAWLPQKMYDENDMYYGPTIKSDTAVTHPAKQWAGDESIEVIEKKDIIEIDKLMPGGKIKRVFTYKEEKGKPVFAAPKNEEVKIDSAAAIVDSAVAVMDTTVTTVIEESAPAKKDTLTRGEYLNDSTYITHYYLPYSEAERDSLQKIYSLQKEMQQQKQALDFVLQYQSCLPAANDAITQQLQADTADIVLYSAYGGASPYSFFSSYLMAGIGASRLLQKQPSSVTAINFTSGQVTMACTYSEAATDTAGVFSRLYKPLTGFWPAALGAPVLGSMQFNTDLPQLFAYIKNTAGRYANIEHEMKKEGIDTDELLQAFTGQAAVAIYPGKSRNGKTKPRLLIALQVNKAAAAVGFMNRAGSKKTKSVNNYRFDENAQYLLIDTDGKNGLLSPAVPGQKAPTPAAGTVATAGVNIKAMLQAFTKDSKKAKPGFKQALQYFSSLQVTAAKNSSGGITSIFTMGMGSNKTNALYNLLQLINAGDGSTRLPVPLSRF